MLRMFALFLSFSIGFVSLGQEMLWFRVVSYQLSGTPQAFAFVLTIYLLGIATGAVIGKNICLQTSQSKVLFLGGVVLLLGGILDVFTPYIMNVGIDKYGESTFIYILLILATSSLKAVIFPIAHHLGSSLDDTAKIGSSVSIVYCCNIVGATLGTIFFGVFLSAYITTYQSFIYIGCFILLLAIGMLIISGVRKILSLVIIFTSIFFIIININIINNPAYWKLNKNSQAIFHAENRYGVIDIRASNTGDIIYGGNIYDGIMKVELIQDESAVRRVIALDVLHPEPKRALVIGVSGGAWLRALSSFPTLEKIDAIELNPGYVDAIELYPEISPILNDHRITIHIDDGRRWIRRNSDKKYDLIIMNTTFYWRSGATNILSQEMMKLLSNSLTDDGIIALNSTRFLDVMKTTSSVFPYTYWGDLGIVYASNKDFLINRTAAAKEHLYQLNFNGVPIFTKGDLSAELAIDRIMSMQMLNLNDIEALSNRPLEIITDKNMINEYKYGKEFDFK